MTIPKDLAKKRDEVWQTYKDVNPPKGQAEFYYIDNTEYFKDGFNFGVLAAFESEHVLALVEALELVVTGTPESGLEKYILIKAKEALAKWSKRNESNEEDPREVVNPKARRPQRKKK